MFEPLNSQKLVLPWQSSTPHAQASHESQAFANQFKSVTNYTAESPRQKLIQSALTLKTRSEALAMQVQTSSQYHSTEQSPFKQETVIVREEANDVMY